MTNIQVLVLIRDEYHDRLPEVAERLQSAGLQIDQWLVEIGVITGSIAAEKMSSLAQIEGVASVESSQDYQIAPPDSGIQ
ncbi:ketohydroxyglutarate aldolase [Cyanobacteria bacterium FACHB-63]|nr:ketohydroxyglutarate aldolase [Cyanobacteria bacterium FACHB-63]